MKNSTSSVLNSVFTRAALAVLALQLVSCTRSEPEPALPSAPESDLGVADALSAPATQIAGEHSHPSEVTWQTFDTFQEMVAAADLVVHGRVVAQRPAVMRLYPYNEAAGRTMTAAEAGDVYDEVPLTISTIEVASVVRSKPGALARGGGALAAAGTQVEIVELGGLLPDGCLSQPGDKPVIGRVDEGVYFLSSAGRPGAYHVVGGWQGRMNVRGGLIRPLASDVHPNASELTRHLGQPVREFLAEVRAMKVD